MSDKTVITDVSMRIGKAQYSKDRFPGEYTEANPFGLIKGRALKDQLAGAFNFGSKVWLDVTPHDHAGPISRELMDQDHQDLYFQPAFTLTHRSPDGTERTGTVKGNGKGGEFEIGDLEGVLGAGGEAYDESHGYVLRLNLIKEGTVKVIVTLQGINDVIELRVS